MDPATALVFLFAIATAVALATRRLRVPYTVALVLAGLAVGAAHPDLGLHLTKELLYSAFLPGLIFEAAYHLELGDVRQNARAMFALAVPGVAVALGATAAMLVTSPNWLGLGESFGWANALVFAALIAATDPIAVVSLFKSLGAPRRLSALIEGESLINDGTAIVLYTLVYAAVSRGHASPLLAAFSFVLVVGVGALVGGVVGFIATHVIRRVDEPMIEITVTVIAAYGSFVLAEQLHVSGVIATVAAGVLCGNLAAPGGMSPTTRIAVSSFWEYVAFALNSLVFLLIGLEVHVGTLLEKWRAILVAFLAVAASRALVVFTVSALLRSTRERIPWRWGAMLTWGGLRGALSMVLALAIPESWPARETIITLTFGVVLLSIVLQGVTSGWLLRRLGLSGQESGEERTQEIRADLFAARAALDVLKRLEQTRAASPATASALRAEYEARAREIELALAAAGRPGAAALDELRRVRRMLLEAEKDSHVRAHQHGLIDAEERNSRTTVIDARMNRRGPHR